MVELTRRDALIALGSAGVTTTALGAVAWSRLTDEEGKPDESETIVAVAEALYPRGTSGIESFVETYVVGRVQGREEYLDGVRTAARRLDEYARYRHDEPYATLDRETRQAVLDEYGLAEREPDPDGGEVQQVRYYLINELLFAFYASPTGGELVGIENPQGYPGGTDSYQYEPPD